MSANVPGQISADGQYYWNGHQWVTTLSPDGAHRWNGSAWVAAAPAAPLAAPLGPPAGPPSNPAPAWLPMDAPGAAPAAAAPAAPPPAYGVPPPGRYAPAAAANRSSLGWQFGGAAAWSIGWGVLAVLVPIFSTNHTYFILLPLFGIWRAFVALRSGRTAGAALGFLLNIVAGLISLNFSGLLGTPI